MIPSPTQLPTHYPEISYPEILFSFIPLIVLANGAIIFSFLTNHRLHIRTNSFVCSYAVIDLLVGAVFIPTLLADANGIISGAMIMYSILVSLLTLIGCTFDRFVAICKPLRYENIQTDNNMKKYVLFTWLFPVAVVLLPQIWLRKPQDILSIPHRVYVGVIAFSMVISLCIMVAVYVRIFLIAYRHLKRSEVEMQLRREQNFTWRRIRKEIKFARLFATLSVTFAVFWFPTGYMSIVDNVFLRADLLPPLWLQNVNFYWIFVSSLLNPLFYCVFQKQFRQTLLAKFTLGRKSNAIVPLNNRNYCATKKRNLSSDSSLEGENEAS